MVKKNKKIVIFTSGKSRGSNFKAIAEFIDKNKIDITIEWVLVTSLKAPIVEHCKKYNIPELFISTKDYIFFELNLIEKIEKTNPDLIVLAGFMKKLTVNFIQSVGIPIFNIHPALLPKFGGKNMYGRYVHEEVWKSKEKVSGATVHFVDELYDHGKIFMQKEVSIIDCKDSDEIAKKVLEVEHYLYPRAICEFLK